MNPQNTGRSLFESLKENPYKQFAVMGTVLLLVLTAFFVVKTIQEVRAYKYVGSDVEAATTITVSGEAEQTVKPDAAEFYVTVQHEADTVSAAQEQVTQKTDDVISFLQEQGIEDKDIRTTQYDIGPRYEYRTQQCLEGYCPPGGERVLAGYQVTQTMRVKVRDLDNAGAIIGGLGEREVTNVTSLQFTVENEETVKEAVRADAIAQAKEKARAIADDLGVRLTRIVSFNEGGGPVYYERAAMDAAPEGKGGASAPNIPTGENTIRANVNVTYEIR